MNCFIKRSLLVIFVLLCQNYFFNVKVLAEENEKEVVSDYKVYVEEDEVTNYDLINDTDVNIRQVYDGEIEGCYYSPEENILIDYSNKLYGNYNYSFSLICDGEVKDSRNITINYSGSNNDIINTNNIYYYDEVYYVLGNLDKNLTVLELIDMFNDNLDAYNASLVVLDESGNSLLDSDVVKSDYKLKLSATYIEYDITNYIEEEFVIKLVDDSNDDGIVDNLDIKYLMVDDVLENKIDIKDVINIGNNNIVDSADILSKNIEDVDQVYIDDEFEIKYYITGFEKDILGGIAGFIEYNTDILELISIDIDSIYGLYNASGRFAYLLDNYNEDGLFITFKFKALAYGKTNVSLREMNFVTVGGDYAKVDSALFSSDISVLYNKGGDEDGTTKEDIEEVIISDNNKVQNLNKKEEVKNVIEVYEELLPAVSAKSISLSSNNYIKKLEIKGYDIEFDEDIFEYSIKVDGDVNKLDLDIELSDNDSYYVVIGNKDFKDGKNEVSIVVTSLDGSTKTYLINVEKEKNIILEEDDLRQEKKTSRNIIILLIILVIIGLIYIIFKDEEETD